MKAKSQELFEKSLAAMVASIEVYNKPDFEYREETFAILAVNGWELLLKAKWLKDNDNKIRSLYVHEKGKKKDGTPSKKLIVKLTRCGNPFTHCPHKVSVPIRCPHKVSNLHNLGVPITEDIGVGATHLTNHPSFPD